MQRSLICPPIAKIDNLEKPISPIQNKHQSKQWKTNEKPMKKTNEKTMKNQWKNQWKTNEKPMKKQTPKQTMKKQWKPKHILNNPIKLKLFPPNIETERRKISKYPHLKTRDPSTSRIKKKEDI